MSKVISEAMFEIEKQTRKQISKQAERRIQEQMRTGWWMRIQTSKQIMGQAKELIDE